jgi:hypothetical protein
VDTAISGRAARTVKPIPEAIGTLIPSVLSDVVELPSVPASPPDQPSSLDNRRSTGVAIADGSVHGLDRNSRYDT